MSWLNMHFPSPQIPSWCDMLVTLLVSQLPIGSLKPASSKRFDMSSTRETSQPDGCPCLPEPGVAVEKSFQSSSAALRSAREAKIPGAGGGGGGLGGGLGSGGDGDGQPVSHSGGLGGEGGQPTVPTQLE